MVDFQHWTTSQRYNHIYKINDNVSYSYLINVFKSVIYDYDHT